MKAAEPTRLSSCYTMTLDFIYGNTSLESRKLMRLVRKGKLNAKSSAKNIEKNQAIPVSI